MTEFVQGLAASDAALEQYAESLTNPTLPDDSRQDSGRRRQSAGIPYFPQVTPCKTRAEWDRFNTRAMAHFAEVQRRGIPDGYESFRESAESDRHTGPNAPNSTGSGQVFNI
jgi:hypothetical protein